jgi:hypothetical protein
VAQPILADSIAGYVEEDQKAQGQNAPLKGQSR